MRLTEGMIVTSNAGHDRDRICVVLRLDGDFAFVADGKHRTLANPKRKNVRHLNATNQIVDLSQCCTDKKLRALCWPYQYGGKDPEEPKGR